MFLFSRGLDESLSEAERERLDAALAASDAQRSEAGKLRAVAEAIRDWGSRPPDLDWNGHEAAILARIAETSDDAALRKVDRLLKRWGSDGPAADEDEFVTAVMTEVRRGERHSRRHPLILRLWAPLAAAAAVAVLLTAPVWFTASRAPIVQVAIGPAVGVIAPSSEAAPGSRVVVSFRREEAIPTPVEAGISFATVGASPVVGGSVEGPPL